MRRASSRLVPAALVSIVVGQLALFLRLRATDSDYDESVYLLSLRALRAGETLGSDVFASQLPGFYWLLRAMGALLGPDLVDLRVGFALLGIVGTVGSWIMTRPTLGPAWALVPAALLAIAPPVPLYGPRVLADLPSLWLAVAALATAVTAARSRHMTALSIAAGALVGAGVSVKVVAAMVIPSVVIVLRRPRPMLLAAAGFAAVWLVVLLANLGSLHALWDSSVEYHRLAQGRGSPLPRTQQLETLVSFRAPFTWLVACALAAVLWRLARREAVRLELALWLWSVLAAVFLLTHTPLHPNHLVFLPVPLALATGTTLGLAARRLPSVDARTGAAVLLGVAIVAGYAQQHRRVTAERTTPPPWLRAAARALEARSTPGEVVVSDVPGVVLETDRLVPGQLVDTASLRFDTGSLTVRGVLDLLDRDCIRVVISGRAFPVQPGLTAGFDARYRNRTRVGRVTIFSGRRTPACDDRSPSS